jgi:hypothetical protein
MGRRENMLGRKEKQEGSHVRNKRGRMEQLEDWKNGREGEKDGTHGWKERKRYRVREFEK